MHKKFFMIVIILLAVAAGLAASASVLHRSRGFDSQGDWMLKHMTRKLNLTTAQQTQIKSIMAEERTKITPLTEQLRQNAQAENATINGNFDEAKARAFADQQATIMSNLTVEKLRAKSKIYAVLTPEQQEKARQLAQRRLEHSKRRLEKTQQTAP